MTSYVSTILLAALLLTAGCSTEQWQREYHAGIRQDCAEKGFAPETQEGKECFARVLLRASAPPPGAKPYRRAKSLEHFME
ncbi:hypothetical protein [Ferrovibrio sp.]|uniref:hypothetical protein n=1 Tax=Ferrovibrio sp. TaxID=1917215 RepID=UPI001B4B34B2|nr:hypothetical protein [Ferrovibrio sp.]MBP7065169.1 hypothetical protein [Ferrovibrio sp.]